MTRRSLAALFAAVTLGSGIALAAPVAASAATAAPAAATCTLPGMHYGACH
jgi:hypothetical protein